MKNYYEILGVPHNANSEQIKKAFRELAKKWHPDKNNADNAHSIFVDINEAYEILIDENKRKKYDFLLNFNNNQEFSNSDDFNDKFDEFWKQYGNWVKYAHEEAERRAKTPYAYSILEWATDTDSEGSAGCGCLFFLIALVTFVPYQLWNMFDFICSCSYSYKIEYLWIVLAVIGFTGGLILLVNMFFSLLLKKEKNIKREFIWAVSLLAIFFSVRYTKCIIEEYKQYKEVINNKSISYCEDYFNDCSNGFFNKNVLEMYDTLLYNQAKKSINEIGNQYYIYNYNAFIDYLDNEYFSKYNYKGTFTDSALSFSEELHYKEAIHSRKLKTIVSFFENYPQSRYTSHLINLRDTLWNIIIEKYEKTAKNKASTQSFDFFNAVLKYMRDNNMTMIYVKFNRILNFNEYDYYNEQVKGDLDTYFSQQQYTNSFPLPSEQNPLSIKDNFSIGNIEEIENEILERLKYGFSNLFGEDLFTIVKSNKDTTKQPIIYLQYTVRNELLPEKIEKIYKQSGTDFNPSVIFPEYRTAYKTFDKMPSLIPYLENEIFSDWLFKIAIEFDGSKFYIPNTNITYELAGDNYSPKVKEWSVFGKEDAYRKLVNSCFIDFKNNILHEFGLYIKSYQEYEKEQDEYDYQQELNNYLQRYKNINKQDDELFEIYKLLQQIENEKDEN